MPQNKDATNEQKLSRLERDEEGLYTKGKKKDKKKDSIEPPRSKHVTFSKFSIAKLRHLLSTNLH